MYVEAGETADRGGGMSTHPPLVFFPVLTLLNRAEPHRAADRRDGGGAGRRMALGITRRRHGQAAALRPGPMPRLVAQASGKAAGALGSAGRQRRPCRGFTGGVEFPSDGLACCASWGFAPSGGEAGGRSKGGGGGGAVSADGDNSATRSRLRRRRNWTARCCASARNVSGRCGY